MIADKRIWVSLPAGAWQVVDTIKNDGEDEATVLERIIIAYLRDKGFSP